MQCQLAFVRQCADLIAFVNSNDTDRTAELFHRCLPLCVMLDIYDLSVISRLFGRLKERNRHFLGEFLKDHLHRHIAFDHLRDRDLC